MSIFTMTKSPVEKAVQNKERPAQIQHTNNTNMTESHQTAQCNLYGRLPHMLVRAQTAQEGGKITRVDFIRY